MVSANSDVDDSGMLYDVHVQSIIDSNDELETLNKSRPTADIDKFFTPAPKIEGKTKQHVKCLSCL